MHSGIINELPQLFFPLVLIVVAYCIKYIKSFFFLKQHSCSYYCTLPPGDKSYACDITSSTTEQTDVTNVQSLLGRGNDAGATDPHVSMEMSLVIKVLPSLRFGQLTARQR